MRIGVRGEGEDQFAGGRMTGDHDGAFATSREGGFGVIEFQSLLLLQGPMTLYTMAVEHILAGRERSDSEGFSVLGIRPSRREVGGGR